MFSFTLVIPVIIPAFLFLRYRRSILANLPPGPPPLPFIGNIHQLPKSDPYKTYTEWTDLYGPIIYMHFFGREFIVLNRLKDVLNLFEKRSAIYSTKPRLVMAGELVGRGKTSILFMEYGPLLQKTRHFVHRWMNARMVKKYYAAQELGSHINLARILDAPQDFSAHIRATAGSVILKLTYGIDTKPYNDPWIEMSESLSKITAEAAAPGRWFVDSFPIMAHIPAWFPGATFKKWANESKKVSQGLVRIPYELVKAKMSKGSQDISWTATELLALGDKPTPTEEEALIAAAGSLYAGGIDTTTIMVRTFILMMIRNPEVQRRAQVDIDRVVGSHRLPQMEDKPSLPYIDWIIKETLRINPIAPLVPHSLDQDDVYEGYRIPKGTWVMANVWAINYDPATYKDPELFNPSRFDDSDGNVPERDPSVHAFGFGRRLCPGYHLTQASMFLYVTHLLSVFEMSPVPDKDGNCSRPPNDFIATHLRFPKPFGCQFKPRSEEKVRLVRDAVANSTCS